MSTALETRGAPETLPLRQRPELLAPLQQLDRRIRRYVLLEGLAWAVIGAGAWVAFSFLLDWGLLFRAFGVDYLRDGLVAGHRVARILALLVLVVGVLASLGYHGFYRFGARFKLADLALVLERRFPGVLGDRLITALELGDAGLARKLQLSWPMVESTFREATDRLKLVELSKVFNRTRLSRLGLTAGILILVGVATAFMNTDAVLTWADRNLLLREVYWPRPVLLQIGGFGAERTRAVPFGSELRLDLHAWKWVVATRENAEGWRQLEWLRDLLPGGAEERPWELAGAVVAPGLFAALPPSWQKLPLDEVNARTESTAAFEPYRREVGLAALRYLRMRVEEKLALDSELANNLLSRAWPDHQEARFKAYLAVAERLTAAECDRLATALESPRPLPMDFVMQAIFVASPAPAPFLPQSIIQKLAGVRNPAAPLFAISPQELGRVPPAWRAEPAAKIVEMLRQAATVDSAEKIGERVRVRLTAMFETLGERSDQSHWGRRRTFRRLEVPLKVTVEFEQLLEGDERARTRPKRGQPEVRRGDGSYAFGYEFKKIEQPLRFRAVAGANGTQWHTIEVKPLPALKRLQRIHDEPGYLHDSDRRVETGPFLMGLEGNELRGEAPAGARVRLEGECYKPLASVRLLSEDPLEPPPGRLVHHSGSASFMLELRPLGKDDLRFQLELVDTDGINAVRRVVIGSLPDREPDFQRASFEVVNRKLITPQAILPLAAYLKDDHGLTAAAYEVLVEKPDHTRLLQARVPFRRFTPLRLGAPSPGANRFERADEIAIGRILGGGLGVSLTAHSAMLRLPQAGWPLLFPLPFGDLPREYRCSYEDQNLYGPILRSDDEFLDTLLLRLAANKPVETSPWPTPYRLVIRLVALDNRREESTGKSLPAAQEGRSQEAFDFQVVTEQELLIELGKKEEDIRDRCEEVLANLKKLRGQLRKQYEEFDTLKDADLKRAIADAQDFVKALQVARSQTDERVLREFRQVYRELALNRVAPKVLERVDERICRPLAQLLEPGNLFTQSSEALETLARRFEAEQSQLPKALLLESAQPIDRLIARLEEVMGEMRKLIEFNQALQALREIIKSMDNNLKAIMDLQKRKQKEELEP